MELERRWKLNSFDDVPQNNIKAILHIIQTYANFNPDVRIRSTENITNNNVPNPEIEYSHCVKYFMKSNEREEIEQTISIEQYNRIFKYIDKTPVEKDRYVVQLNDGFIAEVDMFEDIDKLVVEVEFQDNETMYKFIAPDWFGEEIKENKSYSAKIFKALNNKNFEFELLSLKYSL